MFKTIPCERCDGTGKVMDPRSVGKEARAARLLAGFTLGEVAHLIGYSVPYVSDLEHGRRNWTNDLRARYLAALEKTK